MFKFWKSKGDDTALPTIPGGQELYDQIMQEIEPELTSDGIKTLKAKYKDQSKADHQKRMERYKKAFHAFIKEYQQYQAEQKSAARSYGKTLVQSIEKRAVESDSEKLGDLESAIAKL